jgi:transcriptional regulator with XRE-family HTH domain
VDTLLGEQRRVEIDVGERLRAVRQARGWTLKILAKRAGLSEGFLSQVERGHSSASIASLKRIAMALNVSVADLFDDSNTPRWQVLRREDRPVLAFGVLGRKYMLTPNPMRHLEVLVGELDPGGSTGDEPYTHGESDELFVVLSGSVRIHLGEHAHELGPGDSIGYRSSIPHRAVNVGSDTAEVMWIMSPPSY